MIRTIIRDYVTARKVHKVPPRIAALLTLAGIPGRAVATIIGRPVTLTFVPHGYVPPPGPAKKAPDETGG